LFGAIAAVCLCGWVYGGLSGESTVEGGVALVLVVFIRVGGCRGASPGGGYRHFGPLKMRKGQAKALGQHRYSG
jgi:hypothetical protein